MALINIQSAIKQVKQIVRKLDPPQGVEILTYKRNRGITIIKIDEETLSVQERGYDEYSRVIRTVIPFQSGHPFHLNPDSDSTGNRTAVL